jgi:hypothetical protein
MGTWLRSNEHKSYWISALYLSETYILKKAAFVGGDYGFRTTHSNPIFLKKRKEI